MQSGWCVCWGLAEELAAGTHEFEEVRLLGSLRSGPWISNPTGWTSLIACSVEAGTIPRSRLGLAPDAGAQHVYDAALAALGGVAAHGRASPLQPPGSDGGAAWRSARWRDLVAASRARG